MIETALMCLALNIYHEARGESEAGQKAVALVTVNRAKKKERVCHTVFQPKQFSWTIPLMQHSSSKRFSIALRATPKDVSWQKAKMIAARALQGTLKPVVSKKVTHFHTVRVKPYWAASMKLVAVIGNHKFYQNLDS